MESVVEEVARELSVARESGVLLEAPSHRRPSFSVEDGYAAGRLLHEKRMASGEVPVGLKLGLTNPAVWSRLGLDSPFWSPIYEGTVVQSPGVSLKGLVAPRIEPEIVLGFRNDLAPGASTAEISAAIGWAALGFEIVQCHYHDWHMAPADAIADAGLHAFLIVGDRVDISAHETDALAAVSVELCRDHRSVGRGSGADALGGPAAAIEWLLRLPGIEMLRSGSIVTTGTLTAAMVVAAGETWQLRANGPVELRPLEVAFT